MKNLIIKILSNVEEKNIIEDYHVLIISNKSFVETKKQLINKQYDYFVCNNTLFDNNDNILYSNNISFDSEKFISFVYQNKKIPNINITNSKDENSLSNCVKISIKYNLFADIKSLINELETKYGLIYKFEKGYFNFYSKNGLKNIIDFLIEKNDYINIFNCSYISIRELKKEKYIIKINNEKLKKYRR